MTKKEEFKEFLRNNNYLIKRVQEGKTSYQKLYELFDINGESSNIWDEFKYTSKKIDTSANLKNILGNLKNIDLDKLEDNVNSLEKALSFLEEILVSRDEKRSVKPRKGKISEIERFFDD